jgi:hypothetical protein
VAMRMRHHPAVQAIVDHRLTHRLNRSAARLFASNSPGARWSLRSRLAQMGNH